MESFARVLVALLVLALVINLMRGGPDRVKLWLRAKFLGQDARAAAGGARG